MIPAAPFTMKLAVFPHLLDLAFQRADALPDLPAIHFEFRFAGTARANAAAKPREVVSVAGQSSQAVFELGKLDLKLALLRPSAPGEDVQDQTGPVDDFRLKGFFEVPRLAWRKLVVKDDDVDAFDQHLFAKF